MLALSRAKAIEMWPIDMLPLRWSVVYVVDPFPEVLDDPLQSEQVFICHASIPITPVAGISICLYASCLLSWPKHGHFAKESLPALSQKYGFSLVQVTIFPRRLNCWTSNSSYPHGVLLTTTSGSSSSPRGSRIHRFWNSNQLGSMLFQNYIQDQYAKELPATFLDSTKMSTIQAKVFSIDLTRLKKIRCWRYQPSLSILDSFHPPCS